MARIYKRSDRISVRINDIEIQIAPLTLDQKAEIQQALFLGYTQNNIKEYTKGISLAMKHSIKGLKGLKDANDEDYKLDFENDMLTDQCVDDLMNLECKDKLTMVCSSLVRGIPETFTDEKNQLLDGVEIVAHNKVGDQKN